MRIKHELIAIKVAFLQLFGMEKFLNSIPCYLKYLRLNVTLQIVFCERTLENLSETGKRLLHCSTSTTKIFLT